LIIFSFSRLISTQRSITSARENLEELQQQVVEQELINAELEYAIENYNDPDVIANIARTQLGLVLPGEIVLHNMDSE
jgi:cell division protein FtsB